MLVSISILNLPKMARLVLHSHNKLGNRPTTLGTVVEGLEKYIRFVFWKLKELLDLLVYLDLNYHVIHMYHQRIFQVSLRVIRYHILANISQISL